MNHMLLKRDLSVDETREDQFAIDPIVIPDVVLARFDAERLAPWKESALRTIAFAEARFAKTVGVSGICDEVGSSSITAAIAQGYSDYGHRTLLIDANSAVVGDAAEETQSRLLNLTASAAPINKRLHYVDLSRVGFVLPQKADYFHSIFQTALQFYEVIIADLPTIVTKSGQPSPVNLAAGAACDAVFIVCETGRTTHNEIQQCMASSKVSGMQIEGILLNDYKLPFNKLLSKS
ncbi:MAG: hypothetical protein KTR19_06945 [Hyphomicrobiales bacterium]|nr:hypothetical protein [Hyphomicrobiales bacterium]